MKSLRPCRKMPHLINIQSELTNNHKIALVCEKCNWQSRKNTVHSKRVRFSILYFCLFLFDIQRAFNHQQESGSWKWTYRSRKTLKPVFHHSCAYDMCCVRWSKCNGAQWHFSFAKRATGEFSQCAWQLTHAGCAKFIDSKQNSDRWQFGVAHRLSNVQAPVSLEVQNGDQPSKTSIFTLEKWNMPTL